MALNQNGLGNPSVARIPRPYVLMPLYGLLNWTV